MEMFAVAYALVDDGVKTQKEMLRKVKRKTKKYRLYIVALYIHINNEKSIANKKK